MAVRVLVRLQAHPGEGDRLVDVVSQITPDARAHEGAGEFELVRDLDDPDTVAMVARWRDRAAHEAYMAWRDETGVGTDDLAAVLGAPPVIRYCEIVGEWPQ